jgi:hypothetical protein
MGAHAVPLHVRGSPQGKSGNSTIHIKYLLVPSTMQPLYSLEFSSFITSFGLNRPSSGTSLCQNCYLHLISVIHFICNCIVPYLCCGHNPANISQCTIHCDSLSIAIAKNSLKLLKLIF